MTLSGRCFDTFRRSSLPSGTPYHLYWHWRRLFECVLDQILAILLILATHTQIVPLSIDFTEWLSVSQSVCPSTGCSNHMWLYWTSCHRIQYNGHWCRTCIRTNVFVGIELQGQTFQLVAGFHDETDCGDFSVPGRKTSPHLQLELPPRDPRVQETLFSQDLPENVELHISIRKSGENYSVEERIAHRVLFGNKEKNCSIDLPIKREKKQYKAALVNKARS